MNVIKFRSEFSRQFSAGKDRRDIYRDAIAQGHPEKAVAMLVGQIPSREESRRYRGLRYGIAGLLLMSSLLMFVVGVLIGVADGDPVMIVVCIVESLAALTLGYMVLKNYYIAYMLLLILPIISLGNKLPPALNGDLAMMIGLFLSVTLIVLSSLMIKGQFTHCTFWGKAKVAAGEDVGFWE